MVQDEDRTLLANTLKGGVCEGEVVTLECNFILIELQLLRSAVLNPAYAATAMHELLPLTPSCVTCVCLFFTLKFLVLGHYHITPAGTANLKQMLHITARRFSGFWYSVTFFFFHHRLSFIANPVCFN